MISFSPSGDVLVWTDLAVVDLGVVVVVTFGIKLVVVKTIFGSALVSRPSVALTGASKYWPTGLVSSTLFESDFGKAVLSSEIVLVGKASKCCPTVTVSRLAAIIM